MSPCYINFPFFSLIHANQSKNNFSDYSVLITVILSCWSEFQSLGEAGIQASHLLTAGYFELDR